MQRLCANTYIFIIEVASTLAIFAYGAYCCFCDPFKNSDVYGISIMTIMALIWIPWIECRRLDRKAGSRNGDH